MMTTKEQVLYMLEEAPQGLSGQVLAMRLGVSRAAVWKAVRALKAEGCTIEGVTNRGYRLIRGLDNLSAESISGLCHTPVEVFETLPSTNIIGRERAVSGAPHGTVIIANTQSSGRGRRGRSFVSGGLGIYMSVVLYPDIAPADASLVTTAAAVAVRDAIEQVCGKECGIKWVNDLFLDGKKVCGILTEAVTDMESGEISGMVVGIGINFRGTENDFSPELRNIAGFVMGPDEAPGPDRNALTAQVTVNLLERVAHMEDRQFLEDYRRHSIVLGQRVEYMRGGHRFVGTATGIDDNGALEVYRDDRVRETISAGEVSIRPSLP